MTGRKTLIDCFAAGKIGVLIIVSFDESNAGRSSGWKIENSEVLRNAKIVAESAARPRVEAGNKVSAFWIPPEVS
jgi:hypothetical protein